MKGLSDLHRQVARGGLAASSIYSSLMVSLAYSLLIDFTLMSCIATTMERLPVVANFFSAALLQWLTFGHRYSHHHPLANLHFILCINVLVISRSYIIDVKSCGNVRQRPLECWFMVAYHKTILVTWPFKVRLVLFLLECVYSRWLSSVLT